MVSCTTKCPFMRWKKFPFSCEKPMLANNRQNKTVIIFFIVVILGKILGKRSAKIHKIC